MNHIDLSTLISNCPDFPRKGIMFRDINPLFRTGHALHYVSNELHHRFRDTTIDGIAGIESRGFVIATALALNFDKGLIMIRKAGKLPGHTIKESYDIEYGSAVMEIQKDAIKPRQNVLIADDLIATGGSAIAAAHLIEELGGNVSGFAFVIELTDLKGANKLRTLGYKVQSLVVYD
ncbi:MAG TPA: adenine phosphoribosyltransferase [Nitrososphaeraceae archaeon]|nr:adenine phosphoribosyltransferase [Nitrososphaeraceae archaeon]